MPERLRVTLIRCSTVLLSWGGWHALTDPWFGRHLRGLPVFRRPGRRPEELPPLAAVLVSHLHPDHWDLPALRRLGRPPQRLLLPPGGIAAAGRGLETLGGAPGELAPWTATDVGPVRVTAVPGPHTGPPPDEVNYVLEFPGWGAVFFGGDAKLARPVLTTVRRRHGPMRLALLPVGGTRILGVRTVMSPDDAAEAADLLGAERVVPLHEGGLWLSVPPLSLHPGRAAALAARFARAGQPERAIVLREGAAVEL
jgi:L-ascorbate metabolism protein UlaG (beta-lactamase superfamily)